MFYLPLGFRKENRAAFMLFWIQKNLSNKKKKTKK